MNQILDTKKIYVTPKLKKAKRFYKVNFFFSVFLVCLLSSYYIYAEYDRTKSEEVSKQILGEISNISVVREKNIQEIDTAPMLIILDEREFSFVEEESPEEVSTEQNVPVVQEKKDTDYETIGRIEIPKINVDYPILDRTTDALMKISPTKFWGPEPNEIGNFCIAGHNYRNTKFFSKVPTLAIGDTIKITDTTGRTLTYKIYSKYEVEPEDISCTTQKTNGRKEITLITCTNDNKYRVIIKATEI